MSQQQSLLFYLVIGGGRLAGLEGGRRGALLAGQLGLARAPLFFLAWVSLGAAAGLRSEGFNQAHQGL